MRQKMIRLSFGAIALCCIAFFIMGMTPADPEQWGFHKATSLNRGLCSKVGTWHGVAPDMGITWLVVNTPGQNVINGQLTVQWVEIDPTFGGSFPYAARVTNACGVWKKVGWRTYQFTWIAHGLDQDGILIYTIRASGEAYLVDCDHVDLTCVLEFWLAGDDIYTDPPIVCVPGTAEETRMPLVQASCAPPAP